MKNLLFLLVFIVVAPIAGRAEKMSLQRAEKFYKSNDLVRAEKEILKAIQPPFSSMEEWSKTLNYYFLIKADLYCSEESLYANLHELTILNATYSKCKKVDTKKVYIPTLKTKMESIGEVLLRATDSELEQGHYDSYLTKMDYYVLLSESLELDNNLNFKKLAEVSAKANHYGRAVHYWNKMIQNGYEKEHAYKETLALLYGLKQFDKVDQTLEIAKNEFPYSSSIKEIEILRLIDKDLIFGARKLAQETIEKDPSNTEVVFLLGMLNSRLKNDEEAVESFLNVAHKDASHFKTHLELGKHFLSNSDIEEGNIILAKHYLEKAERINPADTELQTLLVGTYRELNDVRNLQRMTSKFDK